MALKPNPLAKILQDPPPTHVFEVSEDAIAMVTTSDPSKVRVQPLEPGILSVSPVRDNVQNAELLFERLKNLVQANGTRRQRAALVLPDYCARVAVLDFDAFPGSREEQEQLVRFRMRKSVPFDVDSAILSYYAQPAGDAKGVDVVVAVISIEVLARYEAPFRQVSFQPGFVTTSGLTAMNMIPNQPGETISLLAKLSGRTCSVFVLAGNRLKLARCMEMEEGSASEIESILHPTLVYIEDELQAKPSRMMTCGFGPDHAPLTHHWQQDWGMAVTPLQSRFGAPGASNAGLLGYLEGQAA